MDYSAYFFDLDGTLYPKSNGMISQINERIDQWILKTLPMDPADVSEFRGKMFEKYGATLVGLALEYGSDYYESLQYCHDLDIDHYVEPDPLLYSQLSRLAGRKFILTSSYRVYAVRVLKRLGIYDCFDGMVDVIDVYPFPKPSPKAFQRALQITSEKNASSCVFFDDSPRNIRSAKELGFYTVQVGAENPKSVAADDHLDHIDDLGTLKHLFL